MLPKIEEYLIDRVIKLEADNERYHEANMELQLEKEYLEKKVKGLEIASENSSS